MTKRIKLQYYKKIPDGAVKVCRGTVFGNMFKVIRHGGKYTLEESLANYERVIDFILQEIDPNFLDELKGFDLGCFCKLDQKPIYKNYSCHADILLQKLGEL